MGHSYFSCDARHAKSNLIDTLQSCQQQNLWAKLKMSSKVWHAGSMVGSSDRHVLYQTFFLMETWDGKDALYVLTEPSSINKL